MKEGGGGDWGQVAIRKEGDPTPAGSLTPLQLTLGSLALVLAQRHFQLLQRHGLPRGGLGLDHGSLGHGTLCFQCGNRGKCDQQVPCRHLLAAPDKDPLHQAAGRADQIGDTAFGHDPPQTAHTRRLGSGGRHRRGHQAEAHQAHARRGAKTAAHGCPRNSE